MNRKGMLKYPLVRSDDKKAISKLQANLDILQKKHERLEMENEYHKEHGTLRGCPGVPDELAIWLDARVRGGDPAPNPPLIMNGSRQRMKVIEDNIDRLQNNRKEIFKCWKFAGGEGVVNLVDDSLTLVFNRYITERQEKALNKIGFEFCYNECRKRVSHKIFAKLNKLDFIQPSGKRLSDIQPEIPKKKDFER